MIIPIYSDIISKMQVLCGSGCLQIGLSDDLFDGLDELGMRMQHEGGAELFYNVVFKQDYD